MLDINPKKEKQKIIAFLKNVFKEQKMKSAVIGLSGGIDSTVSFYLLSEVLPPENIHIAHLFHFESKIIPSEKFIKDKKIPKENIHFISIRNMVEEIIKEMEIDQSDRVRIGNIAARVRMIILFDLAKKTRSLVCGTENKSENLLGYFTRFGDQASDIEPIEHLYKTQVFLLARHLGIPESIITQKPTAGLWLEQTDEGEFGFTYKEADQVLYLHFEKHLSVEKIERIGFENAVKIINRVKSNEFKHKTPYHI